MVWHNLQFRKVEVANRVECEYRIFANNIQPFNELVNLRIRHVTISSSKLPLIAPSDLRFDSIREYFPRFGSIPF